MIEGLTRQQAVALTAIADSVERTGLTPTFEEIRAAMGVGSKSGVTRVIEALQQRGLIERIANTARSIVITAEGRRRLGRPASSSLLHRLPATLREQLAAHCAATGDDPDAVIADAVRLHLDSFDLVEEAA